MGLAVGEGCEMMPMPILLADPSSPSDIIAVVISENQGCASLLKVEGKLVRCSILGVHVGCILCIGPILLLHLAALDKSSKRGWNGV